MMKLFKNWLFDTTIVNEQTPNNDINVVWIHGANQTSLSFQYLRTLTQFKKEMLVNYKSMNKFYNNLEVLADTINQNPGPHFVIGHSMGGLYALHLTKYINCAGVVSISTPFAGSWTADWAKYVVPSFPLFKDIGRRSDPVKVGKNIEINIPWTQIVSMSGSVPYHGGPNDGVVTIESMKSRDDMQIIEVQHGHYETMCSENVAKILSSCYSRVLAKGY